MLRDGVKYRGQVERSVQRLLLAECLQLDQYRQLAEMQQAVWKGHCR